jgi:anti-anti-sigma factor
VNQLFDAVPVGGNTLRLVGELDIATVPALTAALEELPPDGPITLDLTELTFIDSAGLHAIATCAKGLNGRGPLVLANPTSWVAKVLHITGFDTYSPIEIRQAA